MNVRKKGVRASENLEATDPQSCRVRRRAVVVALMVAAAALRVVALDRFPTPLHQDELSDIYDGYAIATTGADRTGDAWPILIRGMGPGDYHPGLYAYLAAVSTSFGGLSVWWGRLPGALAGIATVYLVYVTGRRLLGDAGALLALAFIAFSPIHTQYSRQAHQGACLVPLFVILCTYACVNLRDRLREHPRSIRWTATLLSGFLIGLSTNAYAGQRLTALLFALLALLIIVMTLGADRSRRSNRILGTAAVWVLAVALGAAPQLFAAVSEPEHFFARGAATCFRLSNGPRWWMETLASNLAANLDPRYLFFSFGEYHVLSVARLALVTLPFLYVGIIAALGTAVLRRRAELVILLAAMAFSLLPGLVTEGQPSPMRTSGVWALYPIVAALGALVIQRSLAGILARSPSFAPRQSTLAGISVVLLLVAVNGVWDAKRYVADPKLHARAAQPHFVALGDWVRENGTPYDRIYVFADGLFGYLYLAAFSGLTPTDFRSVPRDGDVIGLGWENYVRFGRFFFESYELAADDWSRSPQTERWLVLAAEGPLAEFGPGSSVPLARNHAPANDRSTALP